ncbi:MAG: anion permease, partial [Micrococcales bacterium]
KIPMDPVFIVVALVIVIALFFDFTNGFHDTANAMATPIATGAMKPRTAVLVAAVMNLVGAFLSTAVAKTISVDMLNINLAEVGSGAIMVLAGLSGAILWNLTTWFLGLPSSSSHALFGGLIGATLAYAGAAAINGDKIIEKVLIPAILAPLVAGIAAWVATRLSYLATARSQKERSKSGINTGRTKFKVGQWFTSSLVALAHGTNDAQKTMGVITLVLIAGGYQTKDDPVAFWVILSAATAIALGTFSGGWRIIKTMGHGLSEIKPAQGLSAEVAGGSTILASSALGFALSTTQVAAGAIIGSGLGRKGGAVKWGKAGHIVLGWFLTLPAAALVGALSAYLTMVPGVGVALELIVTIALVAVIFKISRRNKIDHKHVGVAAVEDANKAVLTPKQAAKSKKGKK